jgi:hypothetical protein
VGDACDNVNDESINDTDHDGIPNDEEDNFGTDPNDPDSDDDGLNDGQEVQSPFYPVCGPLDPDCDNDGVCDGPATVTGPSGVICTPFDGHGDNCVLVSNGPATPGILTDEIQEDSDGNGIGDACQGDFDGDGVPDQLDNCPFNPNADQTDVNNNDIGDICDLTLAFFKGGGSVDGGCSLVVLPAGGSEGVWGLMSLGLPLIGLAGLRKRKS